MNNFRTLSDKKRFVKCNISNGYIYFNPFDYNGIKKLNKQSRKIVENHARSREFDNYVRNGLIITRQG